MSASAQEATKNSEVIKEKGERTKEPRPGPHKGPKRIRSACPVQGQAQVERRALMGTRPRRCCGREMRARPSADPASAVLGEMSVSSGERPRLGFCCSFRDVSPRMPV